MKQSILELPKSYIYLSYESHIYSSYKKSYRYLIYERVIYIQVTIEVIYLVYIMSTTNNALHAKNFIVYKNLFSLLTGNSLFIKIFY